MDRKEVLFVEHQASISSHGFTWLDVSLADDLAMSDIENKEGRLFRFVRPNSARQGKIDE